MSDADNTRPLPLAGSDPTLRALPATAAAAATPRADAMGSAPAPGPSDAAVTAGGDLPLGSAIGRYLVLSLLGRGGMGVVYLAYDPVLDRRIAVKLLAEPAGDDGTEGRIRMRREAQALARLSHPNVITVHDVDECRGAMYIAMELVEGRTLTEWQVGRGWQAIVEAYLAAARGLNAAHVTGLIHRDFKPDNVLVGDDGRVRVTDFGLARLVGAAGPEAAGSTPGDSQLAHSVTATGAVMGTPRYMAPEQIDGAHAIDARTDQFAWCVALWEALYAEPPFPAGNLALRAAVIRSDAPKVPSGAAVPRAVGRVLLRGLAPDPEARWPSLDALRHELRRATAPRGRTAIAGAVVCAAALAIGVPLARRDATSGPPAPACEGVGAAVAEVWTPAARAGIEASFGATAAPFAAAAAASVTRSIDAWAERWRSGAQDNCRATRVLGTQSESAMGLRAACLARRGAELAVLVTALGRADRALVETARRLELPELDGCDDVAGLAGIAPPPADPARRDELRAIEAEIARLDAELTRGATPERAQQLAPITARLVARASALGWGPLLARARRTAAAAQIDAGDGKAARATLVAAAGSAAAGGDVDALLGIYLHLAELEIALTSDYALGESWLVLAEGALARLGPRPELTLRLLRKRGRLSRRAGRLDDARRAYEQALPLAQAVGRIPELEVLTALGGVASEHGALDRATTHLSRARALARDELGDLHPQSAAIEHELGAVEFRRARYPESEAHFRRALAIRERALGPDALAVADSLDALGNAIIARGRVAEARAVLERAVAIYERRFGPDHPDVASALNALGAAWHRAGDYERELATNQRALSIRERALGPDHPDVGQSLVNVAIAAKALGRWSTVLPSYRRAIAIFTKAHGAEHAMTGIARLNHAEALRAQGQLAAARAEYGVAERVLAKHFDAEHPVHAHIWNGLGQLELAAGAPAAAIPLLERAVAVRARGDDVAEAAESQLALARAIGPSAPRARELATAAREHYRRLGARFARERAAADAWLRAAAPR